MQLPEWITESPDNYAILNRPLIESKTDRIYNYDTDYRCDSWDEPTIYDANTIFFRIQVPNPQKRPETVTEFPSPLSPILKKPELTPTKPVRVASAPIDAENTICNEDKTIWPWQASKTSEGRYPFSPITVTNCNRHRSTRQQRRNNGVSFVTTPIPRCHGRNHPTRQKQTTTTFRWCPPLLSRRKKECFSSQSVSVTSR